jgi:hypothetical protein
MLSMKKSQTRQPGAQIPHPGPWRRDITSAVIRCIQMTAHLADRAGVEAIVDNVLQVLGHPDLLHHLVLVPATDSRHDRPDNTDL